MSRLMLKKGCAVICQQHHATYEGCNNRCRLDSTTLYRDRKLCVVVVVLCRCQPPCRHIRIHAGHRSLPYTNTAGRRLLSRPASTDHRAPSTEHRAPAAFVLNVVQGRSPAYTNTAGRPAASFAGFVGIVVFVNLLGSHLRELACNSGVTSTSSPSPYMGCRCCCGLPPLS